MPLQLPLTPQEYDWLFPYTSPACDSPERAAFRLARLLRHNRRLLLAYEEGAIRELCRQWTARAAVYFGDAGAVEADDTFEIVAASWEVARWPLGGNPLAEAVEVARLSPDDPPAPPRYGPAHALLYRVVCALNVEAVRNQSPDFFVGSHALARAAGVRQTIVCRFLRRMEKDGRLRKTEPGTKHKAARYATFLP